MEGHPGEPVASRHRMRVRWPFHVMIAAVLSCAPKVVSAVTIDQVLAMSKAGVSDAVILEMIAREKTLVTIAPDRIIELRREGVSDAVIVALLKSGVPTEESLRAAADALPPPPVEPIVTVVGHGPQWPNVGHYRVHDRVYDPPAVVAVPVPVLVPTPYASLRRSARRDHPPALERTANPLLCIERMSSGASAFAPALTRVTECPSVMQRGYRER
jgi:hypothetical protein